MKKILLAGLATGVVMLGMAGVASAALIDRGGGLLYDDVLNITWLQDANYAKTSGYVVDGKMSLDAANSWADHLVYHDNVRNIDYTDWRLPKNMGADRPFHFGWWYLSGDETPTQGPQSELSYMYYMNLGLNGYFPNGSWKNDFGIFQDGTFTGQNDVGLVLNLQAGEYRLDYKFWNSSPVESWTFNTNDGNHGVRGIYDGFYAWAVRDGDVATSPVPIPAAGLLLGSGLAGLAAVSRRKRS